MMTAPLIEAWQFDAVAALVVGVAYLLIAALIIIPRIQLHHVWTNKLATATAALFFTSAGGSLLHAFVTASSAHTFPSASPPSVWWSATWHLVIALAAICYLTLRYRAGRFFGTAPMFDDLAHRARLDEVEALEAADTAKIEAEAERDFYVNLMKTINRNSQASIFVKDLEGRYLLVNEAFARCFDKTEAEIIGFTDEVLDPVLAPLWRLADLRAREGLYRLEEVNESPDGQHVFDSAKFPVFDQEGRLYATCGVSLDVTELKRANTALAEACDAADAANAAKSTFLATMSHEIRTPLNAVIGMTDLLLDTEVDAQQHEFLQTVRSSGDALLAVINDILDFSKIESGELKLASALFNLRDEVERCLDLISAAANAKRLDLICYIHDGCPVSVVGDADRIRQILINLLSNAVKFTDTGEVLVTVTSSPTDEGRLQLHVEVTDTGCGISQVGLSKLFTSFSQVDASMTRAHGGTGLGLTISQRLAGAMGGDVSVISDLDAGSTFTVTVVVDSAGFDLGVKPQEPESLAATGLAGLRALVVDDNPTTLRVLDLQLTGLQLDCTVMSTPAEALALVAAGKGYDVALVDATLSPMSGLELAAALHATPGAATLPIILLTSLGIRPTGSFVDVTGTLAKPIKAGALRDALTAAVSPRLTQQAGRPPRVVLDRAVRPLRILLAEDNPVNQRVAQLMLDRLGHRVDIVSNGRAAVDAVISVPYDVVLMDIQMPQMDGLTATRQIRARLPAEQQPHIVAMTANAMVEDRDDCAAAGMESYLSKPVRAQSLQAILARVSATIRPQKDSDSG